MRNFVAISFGKPETVLAKIKLFLSVLNGESCSLAKNLPKTFSIMNYERDCLNRLVPVGTAIVQI